MVLNTSGFLVEVQMKLNHLTSKGLTDDNEKLETIKKNLYLHTII